MRTDTRLESLLEAKAANVVERLVNGVVRPTRKFPLIPTPPVTVKAPVVGVVDAVEPRIFTF